MSDLIERLEARLEWMKTGKPDFADVYMSSGDIDTILSALKTVRGIEAAKRILIEWDEEVKIWRVNTYTSEGWQSGKTVPLSIEAAVGANE